MSQALALKGLSCPDQLEHMFNVVVGNVYDPDFLPPGCPECGKLLEWEECQKCGDIWLSFRAGYGDDVMAPASVTDQGDVMCSQCAEAYDEESLEEDADYFDGDEPY